MAFPDRYPVTVPGYPGAAVRLPPELAQQAGLAHPNLPLPMAATAQNGPSVFDPGIPDLSGSTLQVAPTSARAMPERPPVVPAVPVEKAIEQQLGFAPTMPAGYATPEPTPQGPGPLSPVRIPGRGAGAEEEAAASGGGGGRYPSARELLAQRDWETIAAPRRQVVVPGTPDTFPLVNRRTTRGQEMTPETREQIEQSIRDEASARAQQATADANAAMAQQATAERQAIEDQKVIAEERARRMRVDARMADLQKQQQEAIRDTTEGRSDPFRDRSVGARLLSGLAVALGEIGRAWTGSERNVALEIINAQIDRDVQLQRDEIASAKDRASLTGNLLAQMQDLYGSPEAAESALTARMRAAVVAQNQALVTRKNIGGDAAAKIAAINAQQNALIAQDNAKAEALAQPVIEEVESLKEGRAPSVVSLGPSEKARQEALERRAKEEGSSDPLAVGIDPSATGTVRQRVIEERRSRSFQLTEGPDAGKTVFAKSPEEAAKLRVAIEERGKAIGHLRAIQQLVRDRAWLVSLPGLEGVTARGKINAEIEKHVRLGMASQKKAQGTGVAVSPEEQIGVDILSGRTAVDKGGGVTSTDRMVDEIQQAIDATSMDQEFALSQVTLDPLGKEYVRAATPKPVRETAK